MDYRIRYVKEGDLDQIQKIEEESFSHPFSKKQFLRLYTNYNKIFFIAEKDKEILGYIVGIRGFRKIIVASIAVKEEFRRKGIADKLIRHLIKRARAMVKTLELQVRISNKPAIFFYEGIGFTCKSILHEYYPDKEDAILYCKTFC